MVAQSVLCYTFNQCFVSCSISASLYPNGALIETLKKCFVTHRKILFQLFDTLRQFSTVALFVRLYLCLRKMKELRSIHFQTSIY